MDEKIDSMKDAVDQILFHILKCLGIKFERAMIYHLGVMAGKIKLVEYETGYSEELPNVLWFDRPDLSGIVRAYNYIVYGR